MARALSTKRLAVAERFSQRLKLLKEKGFEIDKEKVKKIPGVKITNKGRIAIDKTIYEKIGSEHIIKALESYLPKSREYRNSKVAQSKDLATKLTERADEISAKFGFNRTEFLKRAESVEGIKVRDDDGVGVIDIDPQYYSDELEEAALKEVYSVDEMVEVVKDTLMEEGLSEGDLENLSEEKIKKTAVGIYMWKDERSVFKKYYEYIDKDTKLPKNNNHFKEHVEDYKKAEKAMSALGKLLSTRGFRSDAYQEKRIEVEAILKNMS